MKNRPQPIKYVPPKKPDPRIIRILQTAALRDPVRPITLPHIHVRDVGW